MIQKQYDELRDQTINITASFLNLIEDLDKVMDCEAKDFVVTYRNKIYDIHKPMDADEDYLQKQLRKELSQLLVERCLKLVFKELKKGRKSGSYDFHSSWDDVLCFTMGQDPDDHKFEKYEEQESYQVVDLEGNQIRSVDLNYDSYSIKNDLGLLDDKQDKIMDTF